MELAEPLTITGIGSEDAASFIGYKLFENGNGQGYCHYYGQFSTNFDTDDDGDGGGHDYSNGWGSHTGDGSGSPIKITGYCSTEGYPSDW